MSKTFSTHLASVLLFGLVQCHVCRQNARLREPLFADWTFVGLLSCVLSHVNNHGLFLCESVKNLVVIILKRNCIFILTFGRILSICKAFPPYEFANVLSNCLWLRICHHTVCMGTASLQCVFFCGSLGFPWLKILPGTFHTGKASCGSSGGL